MADKDKPQIRVYKDSTDIVYERSPLGGGKVIQGETTKVIVGKIGYFPKQTIVDLARAFKERKGRKPVLTDIAENLFFSPQLGDVPGGVVVWLNPQDGRYARSEIVTDVQLRQ